MALSVVVGKGYTFSEGEKITYPKLNLLGAPAITLEGSVSSAQIADGSVTTVKLEQGININSKINDHNLSLTKLEAGTHGQLLYYNADGDLVKLSPGTDGQFLKTKGAGANPEWSAQAGVGTITVDQISAGLDNQIIVASGGVASWQSQTSNSYKLHDTVGKSTFSTSSTWSSDGVVIAASPTETSQSSIWSDWRLSGIDYTTAIVGGGASGLNDGFYSDFSINAVAINAAYSSGISDFDTEVNELLISVELLPVEASHVSLGVYDGTKYIPLITKWSHQVSAVDRTEFSRSLIKVPRLESGIIKLRWVMRSGHAAGNGDKAYFELIGHR